MRQSMTIRMQQNLTLAPQVQHALRLLRMSAPEFTQEVEQALAENPFLEKDDENASSPAAETTPVAFNDASAPGSQDSSRDEAGPPELVSAAAARRNFDDDENDWTERAESPATLHSHLHDQLRLSGMGDRDRALAELIVESLDDDGYLRTPLEELAAMVPAEHDVRTEELAASLKFVQTLEPAGIAARSLRECLLLQLDALPPGTSPASLAVARTIVDSHLQLLGNREWDSLQRLVRCDESSLHAARELIRSLDPRPGRRFGPDDVRYVVPDVIVRKIRGRWQASVNPAVLPRIHINQRYAEALGAGSAGNASISRRLQEARWLLHSMAQRFNTIQRVADAVVARQRAFFDYGDAAMKPLALKNIADEVGLHESTVCRVANGKYMATPRGVFEFRHFFSRRLATENGGTCSATAIRALMKELIANEDPRAPLSDADLARLLGQQGLIVARRTIAKYRGLMRTPSVELRRVRGRSAMPPQPPLGMPRGSGPGEARL